MNLRKPNLLIFFLFLIHCSGLSQDLLSVKDHARKIDSLHRMRTLRMESTQNVPSPFPQQAGLPHTFNRMAKPFQPPIANAPLPAALSRTMAVCFDTAGRYFLQEDTMTYYVTTSLLLSDGNVLISGEWVSRNAPYPAGGFLMKCTDSGTLHWNRLYDSVNRSHYGFINYYKLLELQDGSILMAGATNNPVTQNNDVIFTRTDNAGNIIWSKTYRSRLWQVGGSGSADYFYIQDLQQDPYTGDIFLTSPHWADGYNITRLSATDGAIAWSRYYTLWSANFDRPIGFDIKQHELVSFGRYLPYNGTSFSMYRINKQTGDTIATRFFKPVDVSNFNLGFLNGEQVVKLDNGNYALTGKLYKYYRWGTDTADLYHAGVVEVDPAGTVVQAYCFRNPYTSNNSNTRITIFKDGSGVFSMLHVFSGYTANAYYVQFKNGQILKQRRKYYLGEGMPNENAALRLPDGSDLVVKLLGDSITNINKIEFLNLHISDTASNCLGWDDFGTYIEPYKLEPDTYNMQTIGANDLSESTNKTLISWSTTPYQLPACRQISHCDTLSLLTSADTICVSGSLMLKARKNPGCGTVPFLQYDTSYIQSFRAVNDSVFQFNFKHAGEFKLLGSVQGCSLLTDSIKVIVRRSNGPVNLGKDTVICAGNTLQLNARKGYASYQWQDGSVDSVLKVTQPGTYHVLVTDSCGNPFRDTLEVKPHPPIPFELGPDRTICEKDTITITAPASFFNYNWHPNYHISAVNTPSIRVAPRIDTMYYVSAEKTAGCFVYDSIRVKVNHAPPINLGADASFCAGDSIVLDAGSGFANYQWNNGGSNQQFTVYTPGAYWVKGEAANGCKSADTFRVLNVFTNPVPNLGADAPLCAGTTRLLDPGSYSLYAWNTGSTGRTLVAAQPGVYAVKVTDQHGCTGTDTVEVARIAPLPAGFLPDDTTICSYSKHTLKPAGAFVSYLWSSGSTSSSIIITKAGRYWLEVSDQYHCKGKDTVEIMVKDCLKGLYMPSAFSPNNNGHNDLFRPLIFGHLIKYELAIYNRWGQPVFRTTDIRKGWDGTWGGHLQAGTFVWTCTYQLEDEPVKKEKGIVMVVK